MKWLAILRLIFIAALTAVAAFCVVTVVWIELLNHAAGGAIARKFAQEPNSKWRTGGSLFLAFRQAEDLYRQENGLAQDQLLGNNAEEDREILEKICDAVRASGNWKRSVHDQLGDLLKSWGLWLHPLSLLVILISYFALLFPPLRMKMPLVFWLSMAVIGTGTFSLAIYRGYFRSLGI